MSQKSSKRSKKHVKGEENVEFKAPDSTKTKDEPVKNVKHRSHRTHSGDGDDLKKTIVTDGNSNVDNVNGENSENSQINDSPKRSMQTRSRSNTPSLKIIESTNGVKDEEQPREEVEDLNTNNQTAQSTEQELTETIPCSPTNSIEMDPLVLEKDEEEPIPELQFDENDVDIESEGSNSRCKTRRSQSRNICTPKLADVTIEELEIVEQIPEPRPDSVTPKAVISVTNSNIVNINLQPSEEIVDLNDTSDTYSSVSTDNLSTRAVAGSDTTRNFDLTGQDSFEESSSSAISNRSFADTVKSLSGRRAIHSANRTDYRKFVLKSSVDYKGDIYADYESVQKISLGRKRKSRSSSPTHIKRIKKDTTGIFAYISQPISNLRSTFRKAHSPKLLAVEKKCGFDENQEMDKINFETDNEDHQKKWCNIM